MSILLLLACTCGLLTACGGGVTEPNVLPDSLATSARDGSEATASFAADTPAAATSTEGDDAAPAAAARAMDSIANASTPLLQANNPKALPGTTDRSAVAGVMATDQVPLNKLPISLSALLAFNTDFQLKHEALPDGVPASYDWYGKPRAGTMNRPPAGFSALTGWGQAFWTQGTTNPGAYLLLKNQMTLVCHGSQRQWTLIQSSDTEGAEFRPDFAGNTAKKALAATYIEAPASVIGFNAASAYHFWPKAGRASIPSGEICGMLFLVQARAEPIRAGSYAKPHMLLGMGADYWLNKTAPWDNYKTNKDVAIGRLKLVGTAWSWYGLSTASDADLKKLFTTGYALKP